MKKLTIDYIDYFGYPATMEFELGTVLTADAYVVSYLKGIINSGATIKDFVVEEV